MSQKVREFMAEEHNLVRRNIAPSVAVSHLIRAHGITRDQARRLVNKIGNNRTKLDQAAEILKARAAVLAQK